jgi:hypothetical protein
MTNIPRGKAFYKCGDWIEILAENSIRYQTKEVRLRFFNESVEDGYRREYYNALEYMECDGADWEDLTDEVREAIRAQQRTHAQEMHEFGKTLGQTK